MEDFMDKVIKNIDFQRVYRKRQDFLNKQTLEKMAVLDKDIEECNFIRDYRELKEELDELVRAFFVKENIINKGSNGDYVSILTNGDKQQIALVMQYYYGHNYMKDDDTMAGLILTKSKCFTVYFSGEENQNKKIYQDEDLTKLWQDILAKKYGKNLNA